MTQEKQETKRAIVEYQVVKPFVDAAALGLAIGGVTAFSGKFIEGFAGGACFSLGVYWGKDNLSWLSWLWSTNKPRGKKREIVVNGQPRYFEQVAPGYITREPLVSGFLKNVLGVHKPQRPTYQPEVIPAKPDTLSRVVFTSQDYNGNVVQLLGPDVRNFLRRAYYHKERDRGAGLSQNTWGPKGKHTWPRWYPGPQWYQAMMSLLYNAENGLGIQLIIVITKHPQLQLKLRFDHMETYKHLLWWCFKPPEREVK